MAARLDSSRNPKVGSEQVGSSRTRGEGYRGHLGPCTLFTEFGFSFV